MNTDKHGLKKKRRGANLAAHDKTHGLGSISDYLGEVRLASIRVYPCSSVV
jgi:hypothetical protein